jgi:exodeoxyribonuclease VII large subunit
VQHCEAKGQGDLYLEFEQLKLELGAMGWFDADKKKPIPLFPHVIGIVTSPTGAVIQDMINVITRRFPRVEIQLYPVAVQGDRAAEEISRAIDVFNDRKEVDVIIVGRGGGSIEELWAFNEKQVAESIHRSILPVISAVGHETDFTIADFVADLRAPTPSAAGELAVPSTAELKQQLHQFKRRLTTDMNTKLAHRREGLGRLRNSYFFARPDMFFAQNVQQLDVLKGQLLDKMNQRRILARAQLQEHRLKLEGIDPNTILQRGYAAVKNMDGHYVTGPDQLETGDRIQLIFATGTADAAITGKGTKTP